MPLTFTHPLAVLPLCRFSPRWLSISGLVVGSMSPDFAYYVQRFDVANLAHTVVGGFVVCLPTGLLALGAFHLMRRPLCFVLPQPHRRALTRLAVAPAEFSAQAVLRASVSIVFGAWTHTFWDSFTHSGGWGVQRFPVLRENVFRIGAVEFPGYYLLQHLSSVGGGLLLIAAYVTWLKRQQSAPFNSADSLHDRRRYVILGGLALVALVIATPFAVSFAAHFDGFSAVRVFVFHVGVCTTAVFAPLLALASIALYRNRDQL